MNEQSHKDMSSVDADGAMRPVLEARGIDILFRQKKMKDIQAVHSQLIQMHAGRSIAVIGQSGAGKTTVLRAMSDGFKDSAIFKRKKFKQPTKGGVVELLGREVSYDDLAKDQRIAGLFHHDYKPSSKVFEGVQALAREHAYAGGSDGLIATFIDEPSRNLDLSETNQVFQYIKGMRDKGISVMFATHDQVHALDSSDYTLHLSGGEQIYFGPTSAITGRDVTKVPTETLDFMSDGIRMWEKLKAERERPFVPPFDLAILRAKRPVPETREVIVTADAGLVFNPKDQPPKKIQALDGINISVKKGTVMGLIGPSGCGKSTFVKMVDRMFDREDNLPEISGSIMIDGEEVYGEDVDPVEIRSKIGYVAQKPRCFPGRPLWQEIANGARYSQKFNVNDKKAALILAREYLKKAGLWDELMDKEVLSKRSAGYPGNFLQRGIVKASDAAILAGHLWCQIPKEHDTPLTPEHLRLRSLFGMMSANDNREEVKKFNQSLDALKNDPDYFPDFLNGEGADLSGGQQQRLCIARALASGSKILIMDEPTSSLDPIATAAIEETLLQLRDEGYTIVIVTHGMPQAARICDEIAFCYLGEVLEQGPAAEFFAGPKTEQGRVFATKPYLPPGKDGQQLLIS